MFILKRIFEDYKTHFVKCKSSQTHDGKFRLEKHYDHGEK